ncbi:MAG: ABC transporter ATP-binding protein [Actinomycetia bacterium]|nr:ABC transporter ATP-binding protein [Actinomycetes bacterium]
MSLTRFLRHRATTPPTPQEATPPVLELVDIAKHYPASPPIKALDGVSLTVHPGELVGLVGASGSGKSTLLNIIGTLDRPTAGHAYIEGTAVAELSDADRSGLRAARIGFVFQQFHLLESSTAVSNVSNGLLYQGVPRKQRTRLAIDALERVGLGHRVDHRAAKLSGGERQRVAIARAIVADPAIVLADEPTGNLDSHTSADILTLLGDLNADGTTILIITHDQDLASAFPRRVTVNDGRIIDDHQTQFPTLIPAATQ